MAIDMYHAGKRITVGLSPTLYTVDQMLLALRGHRTVLM